MFHKKHFPTSYIIGLAVAGVATASAIASRVMKHNGSSRDIGIELDTLIFQTGERLEKIAHHIKEKASEQEGKRLGQVIDEVVNDAKGKLDRLALSIKEKYGQSDTAAPAGPEHA